VYDLALKAAQQKVYEAIAHSFADDTLLAALVVCAEPVVHHHGICAALGIETL
jgi:hypothetical protein